MASLVLVYDTSTGRLLAQTAGTAVLTPGSVTSSILASGVVGGAHIAAGAILSANVGSGVLGGAHVANQSLQSSNYGVGSIDGAHILSGAVFRPFATSGEASGLAAIALQGTSGPTLVWSGQGGFTSYLRGNARPTFVIGANIAFDGDFFQIASGPFWQARLNTQQDRFQLNRGIGNAGAGDLSPIIHTIQPSASGGTQYSSGFQIASGGLASGAVAGVHLAAGAVAGVNVASGTAMPPFVVSGGMSGLYNLVGVGSGGGYYVSGYGGVGFAPTGSPAWGRAFLAANLTPDINNAVVILSGPTWGFQLQADNDRARFTRGLGATGAADPSVAIFTWQPAASGGTQAGSGWWIASGGIGSGAVAGVHVAAGTILSAHYGSGTIGGVHIANQSLVSAVYQSGFLATVFYANQSVLSAAVGASILATPHFANQGILSASYASGSVAGVHVAAAALVSANYASGSIGSSHIGFSTLGAPILSASYGSGSIGGIHIAPGGILSANYASGSIGSSHLAVIRHIESFRLSLGAGVFFSGTFSRAFAATPAVVAIAEITTSGVFSSVPQPAMLNVVSTSNFNGQAMTDAGGGGNASIVDVIAMDVA